MKVTLRKFNEQDLIRSKKLKSDFFKELEVAHNLRHPNILLNMGLSRDPVINNFYIVHEFVSHATLFDILHGVRKPIRPKKNKPAQSTPNGQPHPDQFASNSVTNRDNLFHDYPSSSQVHLKSQDRSLLDMRLESQNKLNLNSNRFDNNEQHIQSHNQLLTVNSQSNF